MRAASYFWELLFLGQDAFGSLLWFEAFPLLFPFRHHWIYYDVWNCTFFLSFALKWGRRRGRLHIWKVSQERKRISSIRLPLFRIDNERIYWRLWHRYSYQSICDEISYTCVVTLVHYDVGWQYRVHELYHRCGQWVLWEVHIIYECWIL